MGTNMSYLDEARKHHRCPTVCNSIHGLTQFYLLWSEFWPQMQPDHLGTAVHTTGSPLLAESRSQGPGTHSRGTSPLLRGSLLTHTRTCWHSHSSMHLSRYAS